MRGRSCLSRTGGTGPSPASTSAALTRAFLSDITGGATQGASTIAEQFVKQTLNQENNRTIFEKLREAVLAYHLTRLWKKDKILQRVPEHDLLRPGRLRDRVGGAGVLRQGARLQRKRDAAPGGRHCGDANAADPSLPKCASLLEPGRPRCWPEWSPTPPRSTRSCTRRRRWAPQPGAAGHGPAERHHARRVRSIHPRAVAMSMQPPAAARRRRRTSRAGSSRRSSPRCSSEGVPKALASTAPTTAAEDPYDDRPADAAGRAAGDRR